MPSRIEDYALIGDCESAALVSRDGSIDWLCWPRFDSPACLAALLGTHQNGCWKLAPSGDVRRITRRYRKSTLILETEFETDEGAVTIIDFMPFEEDQCDIVRLVRGVRGQVAMHMEFTLRFNYGKTVPWVYQTEDGCLRMIAGPDMVLLRTPAAVHGENLHTVADFVVREGQTVPFVLTYRASHLSPPRAIDPEKALEHTDAFWKEWTDRCTYEGPWRDQIERSLITLKALTYAPTGGILAAATTSLPEQPGGQRNWDYRFCWIRDAAFALSSLMQTGYYEEAAAWQNWLLRAVAGSPDQLQIVYGLAGERELTEMELPWLPGYANSRPVRVGNAASEQLQLDIYGEISGVLHLARQGKLPRNEQEVELQWKMLEHLETIWREPDEGIWEVRGPRRHFTHSKVMAWMAFDRAIQSSEQFGLEGPIDRWKAVREEIHADVCRKAYDPELGSFVQFYGSKELDANLLFLAKSRFLPSDDPRIVGTVEAIDRSLVKDGFLLRYNTHAVDDGLPPGEGAFLPCSFWLADVYVLLGRLNEAKALFERLLKLPNDVGLLSEEYDFTGKRLLGNFPQAFSHVAFVNTALRLTQAFRVDPKSKLPKAA